MAIRRRVALHQVVHSQTGAVLIARRVLAAFLISGLLSITVGCQRIRDWRENRRQQALLVQLAAVHPVDAHTHIAARGAPFIAMLDRLDMHVLDILYVDDRNEYRRSLDGQRRDAIDFVHASHGRAAWCTTFDPFEIASSTTFPGSAIDSLNRDFSDGAIAAKVWKNIGMQIQTSSGVFVMPDDSALEPIYRDIVAHGKTLIIHAAEPDAAWNRDYANPATEKYYATHPEWDMSKQPSAPLKATILDARNHVLKLNPDLRVIGAHLGSMESDLDGLAAVLDANPNFAVDTAARVVNLTVQQRLKVRAFLMKYQDRILYGSDLSFTPSQDPETAAKSWQRQYLLDWRFFATSDRFPYWGHEVQGLALPESVVRKIFHDNALHWIPGLEQAPTS